MHEAESFLADTVIAQCFKCFGYGHQARFCKNKAVCGACGGQHERRACQVSEQLLKPKCCNCRGAHPAWASVCPVRQEAAKKAREAWNTCPGKYEIPTATSVPALQPPPQLCFSLSLSLYQEGKNVKQLSQAEAQSDSEVHSQKCKFFLQDQPTLEESYQLTPSRSLMLRCLHERHKADTSPV